MLSEQRWLKKYHQASSLNFQHMASHHVWLELNSTVFSPLFSSEPSDAGADTHRKCWLYKFKLKTKARCWQVLVCFLVRMKGCKRNWLSSVKKFSAVFLPPLRTAGLFSSRNTSNKYCWHFIINIINVAWVWITSPKLHSAPLSLWLL